MKKRADILLVERGLAPSREKARALVMAGVVYAGERRVDKPGDALDEAAELTVRGAREPFVSRGGRKLDGALRVLAVDPAGWRCLDVGQSTGGFTDCLLQRGAAHVVGVDVGYGQLDWRLREDSRVTAIERTNARNLAPEQIGEPVDLAVIDVSFIALRLVLPAVGACVKPGGAILAMVKPQFEVGKGRVGAGGVVRDEALRREAIDAVRAFAETELGWRIAGEADSEVEGPKGNREAFLLLVKTHVAQPPPAGERRNSHVAQPPPAVQEKLPKSKTGKAQYHRNLPHIQSPGRTYFVTFRTHHGLVLDPAERSLVLSHCLHDNGRSVDMIAVVVMPDHVHLLFTPLRDSELVPFSLSQVVGAIKGASAHSVNRALGRRGHVWQDESFDHVVRSYENLRKVGEYIAENPVRKGLSNSQDDYPWLWRRWVEGEGEVRGL